MNMYIGIYCMTKITAVFQNDKSSAPYVCITNTYCFIFLVVFDHQWGERSGSSKATLQRNDGGREEKDETAK